MKWTEFQKARIAGQEKDVPWWVNDKIKFYKFCQEHKLPTPEIRKCWKHPGEIDLSEAGDSFVLKPSVLHSGRGVMVLTRDKSSPEFFNEALKKRRLSESEIKEEQIRLYEECKFKGTYQIFIEETVLSDDDIGPIPLDYKVFTFYGKPVMVFQCNRNYAPKRVAWFDGEFRPLRIKESLTSTWKLINQGVHLLPREWEAMLDIASRGSIAVKTPFISVDMYSSKRGPLIGEMTPAPGGPYYGDWYKLTEEFDRYMGREWELAAQRIQEARIA